MESLLKFLANVFVTVPETVPMCKTSKRISQVAGKVKELVEQICNFDIDAQDLMQVNIADY